MTLRIWITSFIPLTIANYTKPVPNHPGKTMIPGPTDANDCFWTDQRTFMASESAPSRMRSMVEIDTSDLKQLSQSHHCDNTIECDCEDGSEECNKPPDRSGLQVENFIATGGRCSFTFRGSAGNPCFLIAPKIEWVVNMLVEKNGSTYTVKLLPGSLVEPFPAFEMYARLNGGTPKKLFTRSPDPGATPGDLVGPPSKPVTGTLSLP